MAWHHDKPRLETRQSIGDALRRIEFVVTPTSFVTKTETEPLEGSEALLCAEIELAHTRPVWFEVAHGIGRRYPQHQDDRKPHSPSSVAHRST